MNVSDTVSETLAYIDGLRPRGDAPTVVHIIAVDSTKEIEECLLDRGANQHDEAKGSRQYTLPNLVVNIFTPKTENAPLCAK